ncbi:glycosyltransferase family 2 protein [Celeribacter litoreus]|uniref:glycosyltransferase family 2 protein n=1 Tax=Celeribacter litoreus TaxID=2876714 RepID=UPI001CCCA3A2|nr:glycosyltransferase family 2 protein [Celeribacter litoreus]MCA0044213.1 glycosyltransferase [Celeribacter litoreus]
MPLISVVIPVFNAAHTLTDTIRSVQAQSFTDWEIILVDDGSTDGSFDIAQSLAARDPRLRVHRNPRKGPSAARNHGALTLARGEIVSFCDADDLWTPRKLADVAEALDVGSVDAIFGRVGFFATDPSRPTSVSSVDEGHISLQMLLGENPVCTLSNLSLKRGLFCRLGGFREDMKHNEDLEFLVQLLGNRAVLRGLDLDHVRYRLSPSGLSADLDAMRESRNEVLQAAACYGVETTETAEAQYLRYLTRRAMRLGVEPSRVQAFVREGLRTKATAFCVPLRRGATTALGSLIYPFLSCGQRRFLFSR